MRALGLKNNLLDECITEGVDGGQMFSFGSTLSTCEHGTAGQVLLQYCVTDVSNVCMKNKLF